MAIPMDHSRYKSLMAREHHADMVKWETVNPAELISHGRGEPLDCFMGEKTIAPALEAEKVAVALLLRAKNPVICMNGNSVVLDPEGLIALSAVVLAKMVNISHCTEERLERLIQYMESQGAENVLGRNPDAHIPRLISGHALCTAEGVYSRGVIVVPIEDGDRTGALAATGKIVISIDLNPLSRTSMAVSVSISDEITRTLANIAGFVNEFKGKDDEIDSVIGSYSNARVRRDIIQCICDSLMAEFKERGDTMEDLVKKGSLRLHWAYDHMPIIQELDRRFREEQPLAGLKIGMALHTEAKTGMLAVTLANAGAEIRLASCNPLSTEDSVVAALRKEFGIKVYAKKFETVEEYYANLNAVLDMYPDFIIDDGADLIAMAHTSRREVLSNIKGGNEETTTGIVRLRAMAADGKLEFPVMDVNGSKMKYLFDNRYGTGQSAFDGWMNATNLIVAGKHMVVAGYGWCGRGIAMRAKGLGAIVTITEIDPVRAIEARMDGFDVAPMSEAVKAADIIMTVTGCKDVVTRKDLTNIKDGCVMGNVGHFDNEISKKDLDELSVSVTKVREFVDCYTFMDGRKVYLIGEGRLMNLVAGQGHPAEIMDSSFAIQVQAIVYMSRNHDNLSSGVLSVPAEIDDMVARIKLKSLGIEIDTLTDEQHRYIHGWQEGT